MDEHKLAAARANEFHASESIEGLPHVHGLDPAHGVEERRLPRAVRTDERDPLAGPERERDAVDGDGRPVAHDEITDLDESGHKDAEPR